MCVGGLSKVTPPVLPSQQGSQLTKEQLLLKMETVDRDIAATESQILALQKRQVGALASFFVFNDTGLCLMS